MARGHLLTIVGARPQFIKAAAVSRAIREHNARGAAPHIRETLVHTGQHYDDDMSQVFFDELDLPQPDHHLGVGSLPRGACGGAMRNAHHDRPAGSPAQPDCAPSGNLWPAMEGWPTLLLDGYDASHAS